MMDLVEDCGRTYRMASDTGGRMMNHAIFSKNGVNLMDRFLLSSGNRSRLIVEPFSG